MRRGRQCGSAMMEFVLTGIPALLIWVYVVQMCFGMWSYHSLAAAVNRAGAFAAVHGATCSPPNNCVTYVSDTAKVLQQAAIGVLPASINVTLRAWKTADDARTNTATSSLTCRLDRCISQSPNPTTPWPPATYNEAGTSVIEIQAESVWRSSNPLLMGAYHLSASARQLVLF